MNTENGDFTDIEPDLLVRGYGPPLSFTRTYDAQLAQQETQMGAPGPLGYGWTDNLAASLATNRPVPGNIYTLDGTSTADGNGGAPTSAVLEGPGSVFVKGSDVYIADSGENRVEEIPGTAKTQWGVTMTAGDMYTIAGSDAGTPGASGNGTAAGNTLLDSPGALTLDSAGNLFIADTGNHRVVEIAAATGSQWGSISMTGSHMYVIAGRTGEAAVGNDNKPATQSDLNAPESLHMGAGSSEDLYIADTGNNRIQEIAGASGENEWGQTGMTLGDVYTAAGSAAGTAGSTGDGVAAGSALLDFPEGVTISGAGDMYIADTDNARVEEVPDASGTQWGTIAMTAFDMYTVAGRTGQPGVGNDSKPATQSDLDFPSSVRDTNGGNLYISDQGNNRVQEVAATTHTEFTQAMTANDVYTVAGSAAGTGGFSGDGGLGTSALLNQPGDTFLDSSGNIYIADLLPGRVRLLSSATGNIATFAGDGFNHRTLGNGGLATAAGLDTPSAVGTDSKGNVYIADTVNNRVQEIPASSHTQFQIPMSAGDVYTIAGSAFGSPGTSGDGGRATAARLHGPAGIAVDAAGNVYFADSSNNRIQKVAASTGNISTIAGSAAGNPGITGDGGPATTAFLNKPWGLALDKAGNLYIADTFNNRIQEIPAASGSQWGQPMTAGDIYTIAGSAAGTSGSSGNGGTGTSARLSTPFGVATDATGDVYIADAFNNRIQELAATSGKHFGQQMTAGDIYTVAGSAGGASGIAGDGGPARSALLSEPVAVAVDTSGDLYLSDAFNNRIQEVPAASGTQWSQQMTAGDIYTVAGSATGALGSGGDGGPATSALLNGPFGVSVDPAGNIYIADESSNRVRQVAATSAGVLPADPTPGTTVSGTTIPGTVVISQPDGSQVTFLTAQPDGSCAAPYVTAGSYCALPQNTGAALTFDNSTQAYKFTPFPGFNEVFGSNGAFTGETKSSGDALAITPNKPAPGSGSCPSAAATCELVTAASGRTLVIASNSNGLITSVIDPMGRTWTYTYNSSGDLTSATDPMNRVTSYTYGSATTATACSTGSSGDPLLSHDMLTVTGPNGQIGGPDAGRSTVNTYNPAGQVISQTDPMGFEDTFDYCGMNPSTGNGITTLTDANGYKNVDYYMQGALAAATVWTGSAPSEDDFGPDMNISAASGSGGTLLDSWTAYGGRRALFANDAAGNNISVTDPLGNTTTSWPTALGDPRCAANAMASSPCSASEQGPAPVSPGGVITPPQSAPPRGVTYTLFDNSGHELYTTEGVYPPSSTNASYTQTDYTLYKGNSVTLNGNTINCATQPPSASLPCANIDPGGVVTQMGYDSQGNLVSVSTPGGNGAQPALSTISYNADGEPISSTTPDGHLPGANAANYTTTTAYNADGEVTSETQAGESGATVPSRNTTYGYDADGNPTTVKDPRGYTTATAYDADDGETTATDPDGNTTLTCSDGDGNITQEVPPAGVAANNLTVSSCPTNFPSAYGSRLAADATTYTYDASGRETSTSTPAPAGQTGPETTTFQYDAAGDLTKTIGPPGSNSPSAPGQVTSGTYDADGRPLTQTTGDGTSASTTSFCYDPNGDQTSVVSPDGNASGVAACQTSSPWEVSSDPSSPQALGQSTFSYDSAGEPVSSTGPATSAAQAGPTTSMTYDPAGNLIKTTDPNGITATSTYTPDGQAATVAYSGNSAHSVTYTYDAEGQPTTTTDGTGSSSYAYDPFGELTSATNGAGQAISYAYDADGNTTGITYPLPASATWAASGTVTYGFDHADLLTSVTDFNANKITIGDTPDGLPNSIGLGSTGDTVSTTYDNTDNPSAISLTNGSSTLQGFTYAEAPSGNVLSETDTPASPRSPAVYAYDPHGWLTSMTAGSGNALSYGYDPSGNMTTTPAGAAGTYDNAGELTKSVLSGATTNYAYDPDGQRLTAQQNSATTAAGTWNDASQLTSYTDQAADMSTAEYDGSGLRTSATTTPAGGQPSTQDFTWDPAGTGLLMDSTNAYIYGAGTTPAEQVNLSTGTITYLATDALGSVRGLVNPAGTLTASTSYDAWGNPREAGGLTSHTPFGYAGGYTDPTGLIYLVSRYYDPATGQFLSADPAADQTGTPYSYTGDDPVDQTDPLGLASSGWTEILTTHFPAWFNEASFEHWVAFVLGVPSAGRGYTIDTEAPRSKYRVVDIMYTIKFKGRSIGKWMNELKVGRQSISTGRNSTEISSDRTLLRTKGNGFCHPIPGLSCQPLRNQILGADWWFGAKDGQSCQNNNVATCPRGRLWGRLLHTSPHINMILVYHVRGRRQRVRDRMYTEHKRMIRRLLQSNKCPAPKIDKYAPTWPFQYSCDYYP